MFGEELRKARLAAALTQEDLASRAGLTREYVSLLELNKRIPTIPVFVWLCRALNVSPGELIERIDWPKPNALAARTGGAPAAKQRRQGR